MTVSYILTATYREKKLEKSHIVFVLSSNSVEVFYKDIELHIL